MQPNTITPPCAVLSPMRAAGLPPTRTFVEPLMIESGGPTQVTTSPMHAAGKPGTERARHLQKIRLPMLFLSGTRDALATPSLLEDLVRGLPAAKLHWLDTADHGYRVLQRERGDKGSVFDETAREARAFVDAH